MGTISREREEELRTFIKEMIERRFSARELEGVLRDSPLSLEELIYVHRRVRNLRVAHALRNAVRRRMFQVVGSLKQAHVLIAYTIEHRQRRQLAQACAPFFTKRDLLILRQSMRPRLRILAELMEELPNRSRHARRER